MALIRVKKGSDIKIEPLNSVVDQVVKNTKAIGSPFPDIRQSGNMIYAINKTGTDLKTGDIAAFKLDEVVPSFFDDDPAKLVATGSQAILREVDFDTYSDPAINDTGNFVVTGQVIPIDQGGWVFDSGLILARMGEAMGSDEFLEYCDIDDTLAAPFILKQRAEGTARILQNLGTTGIAGEDWVYIRFGFKKDELLWKATSTPADGEVTVAWSDAEGVAGPNEITVIVPPE